MPAFVTVAAGLWSDPAVWSPAPPSGGPGLNQADNDTVTISHDVTHDRAGITWLGTGAGGNIAVQINAGGVLRMSRSVSGTLRLWGRLNVAALGILDCGTIASPIPAGTTATIQFRSASAAFGLDATNDSETYFHGTASRTRWTRLIAPVASGTTIRVADATGWQPGDPIMFASATGAFNAPHVSRVSTVTMLAPGDWQVVLTTAVNVAYAQRKPVGNMGANVHLHSVRPTTPFEDDWDLRNGGAAGMYLAFVNSTHARANTRVLRSCRVGVGGAGGTRMMSITNSVVGSQAWASVSDVGFASWGSTGIDWLTQHGRFEVRNCVIGAADLLATANDWQSNGVDWDFADCLIPYAIIHHSGGSITRQRWRRCHWGGTHAWQPGNHRSWSDTLFEDCEFGAPGADLGMTGAGTGATFVRCVFGVPFSEDNVRGFMEAAPWIGFMPRFDRAAIVAFTYIDCRWPASTNLDARYAVAGGGWVSPPSLAPATRLIIANYNANPNDQRIYTPDGVYRNDTVTFRSAPYSLRYSAYSTNRPQELSFQVLAPHNAQALVAGFLRRDTAYIGGGGTVTVTLSGAGITPVTYTSAGAADAWEPFAFSVVQTTGFPATLKLTITFRGSAGNAWVDDIIAPATQAISTGEFGFWADGQPIGAIMANFAPAADVWAIPLAALATPGSIGEALARVEGTIDIRQALRVLLSVAAGNVTGAPGTPAFASIDGSRTRLAGTATTDGNRTRTILDVS